MIAVGIETSRLFTMLRSESLEVSPGRVEQFTIGVQPQRVRDVHRRPPGDLGAGLEG